MSESPRQQQHKRLPATRESHFGWLRRPSRGRKYPPRNPFRPSGEKHSFQKSRMIALPPLSLSLSRISSTMERCTRVQLSKHRHESNIGARHRVIPTRLSIIAIAGCVNIGLKGFTVIVFTHNPCSRSRFPGNELSGELSTSLLGRVVPITNPDYGLWWISFEPTRFRGCAPSTGIGGGERESLTRRDNRFAGVFGITLTRWPG